MIEKVSAYDIALSRAKRENKLLIYCECDDIFGDCAYNYFYYHKFTSIITFCKALKKICKDISNNFEKFDYEFSKNLSNNDFSIVIDGWRKIHVTNFPSSLNINRHKETIEYHFGKLCNQ